MVTKSKNNIFTPKVLNHTKTKHSIAKYVEPTFDTQALESVH